MSTSESLVAEEVFITDDMLQRALDRITAEQHEETAKPPEEPIRYINRWDRRRCRAYLLGVW